MGAREGNPWTDCPGGPTAVIGGRSGSAPSWTTHKESNEREGAKRGESAAVGTGREARRRRVRVSFPHTEGPLGSGALSQRALCRALRDCSRAFRAREADDRVAARLVWPCPRRRAGRRPIAEAGGLFPRSSTDRSAPTPDV